MTFNKLTPEEERVILNKGTEPPFTGKYYKHQAQGLIPASSAILHSIIHRISSIRTVAGPVSMTKSPAP